MIALTLKIALMIGAGAALMYFGLVMGSCMGFWYGSHCIEGSHRCPTSFHSGHTISSGDVITSFFAIFLAVQKFIEMAPALKKFNDGRAAAAEIF